MGEESLREVCEGGVKGREVEEYGREKGKGNIDGLEVRGWEVKGSDSTRGEVGMGTKGRESDGSGSRDRKV